jgi:hypothetical protein
LQLSLLAEKIRENEIGLESESPSFRAGIWRIQPVSDAGLQAHRQFPEIDQLGYGGIDRHRPFFRFPVVVAFGLKRQGPGARPGIGHERLDKGAADVRPVAVAGNGPDMVGQCAQGPGSPHGQHDRGRPHAPFLPTKQRIRSRREENDRPGAPQQAAGRRLLRREEETQAGVPQAELGAFARKDVVLINHRHNRPRNQVPVFCQMEGDHRLDVGPQALALIPGTDVLVVVHLDRDRHQVGKGIGQILGQIGGLIHGYRIVSPSRLQ